MESLFTSGRWTVKAGSEDRFVAAWEEFARWTKENVAGAGWVFLLRDRSQPNLFVSIGPWESESAVEAWRASEGFQSRVARIRELLDGFEPSTLTPVVQLEG